MTCADFDALNIAPGETKTYLGIKIRNEHTTSWVVSGDGESYRSRSGTRAVFYVNKILGARKKSEKKR